MPGRHRPHDESLARGVRRSHGPEIAAIESAIAGHGPTRRGALAGYVDVRLWGPGRFRLALRQAVDEGYTASAIDLKPIMWSVTPETDSSRVTEPQARTNRSQASVRG